MATKKLKKKVQRKSAASKLSAPVMESAREVWLAGLGALNIAQQEGGKIIEQGGKLFERLVEEGSKVETKTRKDIEGAVNDLRSEVGQRMEGVKQQAESVRKQAADNWDKLEKIFEERVARALASLGIPTRDDINGLSKRVEELAERVRELSSGKPAPGSAAAPKKASGKKPTKKKAVKKTVVKKSGSSGS